MFDEPLGRPRDHVVFAIGRRRQCVERTDDRVRIDCGSPAGIDDQAAAAATEIDAEPLEHTSGATIGRDDLADRDRAHSLVHGSPSDLSQRSEPRRTRV